jgi:ribosomal protein S18 acetylase RimI-like enzyme
MKLVIKNIKNPTNTGALRRLTNWGENSYLKSAIDKGIIVHTHQAFVGEKLVGWSAVHWCPYRKTKLMVGTYVLKKYRHNGIGSKLTALAIKQLKQRKKNR